MWVVTEHAIQRYRERIDRRATHEEARAVLDNWATSAHYVCTLPSGMEQWRAPKPTRARLRVAWTHGRRELVSVIEAHDGLKRR